ncbi:MAG TPA: beta-N-acetylhexosaminidase [Gemmatimonadaceae bacterium]|nr:beta-N-acetylhexosaminidase [Gemmatimonadaceae bacterium]
MKRLRAPGVRLSAASALLLAAALGCGDVAAEPLDHVAIVPRPVRVASGEGSYALLSTTVIRHGPGTRGVAERLRDYLEPATGFRLEVREANDIGPGGIHLRLDPSLAPLGSEGYRLEIRTDGVRIGAVAPAGLFYGVQTLRQLLPPEIYAPTPQRREWSWPVVTVEDRPRFAWRGLHLDVARHFMPVEVVKRYLELMALHKMNVFHWHLTDDQGWRLEIRRYPRLTQVGGWRDRTLRAWPQRDSTRERYEERRHGGFYTQAQVREIVAFARERFISVVPEIEMPGHAQAAIAAYPELGVTGDTVKPWTRWGVSTTILNPEESTVRFMQDVLTEVLELFPSAFIHVGGDEAAKDQWKASPRVQALMKERGLESEAELQSWFIHQMDAWLAARNRRLIGWDEILEGGLAPNAAVMSWRGTEGGIRAAQSGHDVVMAPVRYTYLDSYQTEEREDDWGEPLAIDNYLPLDRVYRFEPLEGLAREHWPRVLGAQGQLWTEYIPDGKNLEYKAYPRATALAEVVWSLPERRDWADFQARLVPHLARLDAMGVNFRRP